MVRSVREGLYALNTGKGIYPKIENFPYKINATLLRHNVYEESYRELLVSYLPMLPLLDNADARMEEADYILYMHCYARIKDMAPIVLEQLDYISRVRKKGAKIVVVGKACNIKEYLDELGIEDIIYLQSHYTERLGEMFGLPIKEEYFVYDERHKRLNIWPVDGCLNKCKFCRRCYMDIPFESLSFEEIKERLDYYKEHHPELLETISLRAENLTQYGLDIYGRRELAKLIDLISSYDEVKKIDFPIGMCIGEITDEILEALCRSGKVNSIALNLETGSDRLLKTIGKGHTNERAILIYKVLRSFYPNIRICSTIMVGLPTEELADMYELARLIEKAQPDEILLNYYGNNERLPLSELPQLSPSLRAYHLKILLGELKKLSIPKNLFVASPSILDPKKRKDRRIIEKNEIRQQQLDNGCYPATEMLLVPKGSKHSHHK